MKQAIHVEMKTLRSLNFALSCLLWLTAFAFSNACLAELGAGKTEHISAGLRLQKLQLRNVNDLYSVQELTLETGTVVKEYINSTGKVYGVSWQGPIKPDLRLFLGDKALSRLSPISTQKNLDHHHASMNSADLVIISRGQGRLFSGKAFAPLLAPASIGIDQIE